MAQQDTGLGWSAKSDWLLYSGAVQVGAISTLVGAVQVPVAVSAAELVFAGLRTQVEDVPGAYTNYIIIGTDPGVEVFCFFAGTSPSYTLYLVGPENAKVYTCDYDSVSGTTSAYGIRTLSMSLSTFPGYYWYFGRGGTIGTYVTLNPDIPIYASSYDAAQNITRTETPITKTNAGYAVGCFAKWRTSGGMYFKTPVLISSVSENVDMALSSSEYSIAKLRYRHNGMSFYMSFFDIPESETISSLLNVVDATQEPVNTTLSELFELIASENNSNIVVTETVDPYEDFGNTEEDAGETDPDPDDDDIEEDDIPTTSFADAGFCRIYKPSLSQLNDLANYIWTDQTFLQTVINHLKQILENPIDSIISLSIVPCVPNTGTNTEVNVMYIPTGVYMPPVLNQFVEVDCGSFALKEMYGSALDYNPYTSVQLYLPYIGIVQLDTDEVMGKNLHIAYRIDVVTGVCCAYVKAGNDVLYQFSGHCSIQQPITSADFSGYVGAAIAAGKLVASIAAAGAGAPEVAATLAGAPTPSISGTSSETRITERNEATGRQITKGTRKKETVTENPGASFGEIATRGVSNTVGAVMNSKTIVQHSGGFSGNSGYLAAVRRPYLIVTRPRIANPENYGQFNGRPSMIYLNLGSCTGFTQVQSIQLTGIKATNPELSEIATLLTSGVIF